MKEKITITGFNGLKQESVTCVYDFDKEVKKLYGKNFPLPVDEYKLQKASSLAMAEKKGYQVSIETI